jgi:hypothetical protein
MSSELRRVDGDSGVEPMNAVTTFVVGMVGLAGVAVRLALGPFEGLFVGGPIVIAGCR